MNVQALSLSLGCSGRSRRERKELIHKIIKYSEVQRCTLVRFFTELFSTKPKKGSSRVSRGRTFFWFGKVPIFLECTIGYHGVVKGK